MKPCFVFGLFFVFLRKKLYSTNISLGDSNYIQIQSMQTKDKEFKMKHFSSCSHKTKCLTVCQQLSHLCVFISPILGETSGTKFILKFNISESLIKSLELWMSKLWAIKCSSLGQYVGTKCNSSYSSSQLYPTKWKWMPC